MLLMVQARKPDLDEHEEEAIPFDDVMRKLLEAKPSNGATPAESGADPSDD